MGFGYGRTTYHGNKEANDRRNGKRVGSVFDNSMVAHVWNAQRQDFGRSHNGNFYFEGDTLFSYGTHFPVAHIAPDGAAIHNSDTFGVSTSGHQSDAANASRNRVRFYVPSLGELLPAFVALESGHADSAAKRARAYAQEHAEALARSREIPAGDYGGRWSAEEATAGRTALDYLAVLFGFGRSAAKIHREAVAKRERKEREEAKRELERRKEEARRLADMTDSDWRRFLSIRPNEWNQLHGFKSTATAINRARRDAKALGLSDKRKARLWAREKRLRLIIGEWTQRQAVASLRKDLRDAIATIRRKLPEVTSGFGAEAPSADMWRAVESARAVRRAASVLAASRRLPFLSRRRLELLEQEASKREEAWQESYKAKRAAEVAEERRLAEATAEEQRLAWLAGESPRLFRRFDCPNGGAALRAYGEELQTSHGASVPLAHAIKAFRFLKLIRERGEGWKRNGHTVRVGHFQIDRIESDGSFVAGCHDIKWPEVERLARELGVFGEEASGEAEERSAA